MICQRCGYSLFNLARENCPECGQPFEVTDYRFDPGAVEFLCPQCDQIHDGCDGHGLPDPREFLCARCGAALRAARMVVRPLTPTAEGRLHRSPWDRTEELGFWRGWWQTVRWTMFRPFEFFRTHAADDLPVATEFAGVTLFFGTAVGGSLVILFDFLAVAAAESRWDPLIDALFAVPLYVGFALLVSLLGSIAVAFFQSLAVHGAMRILEPQSESFRHTFRAILYSFGPAATLAIPLAGLVIAPVWMTVTAIQGVRAVHRTSGLIAAVAVLWLPTLLVLLLFLVP